MGLICNDAGALYTFAECLWRVQLEKDLHDIHPASDWMRTSGIRSYIVLMRIGGFLYFL